MVRRWGCAARVARLALSGDHCASSTGRDGRRNTRFRVYCGGGKATAASELGCELCEKTAAAYGADPGAPRRGAGRPPADGVRVGDRRVPAARRQRATVDDRRGASGIRVRRRRTTGDGEFCRAYSANDRSG